MKKKVSDKHRIHTQNRFSTDQVEVVKILNGYEMFKCSTLIIIKCMCSRCRRDDIHVIFAYASPQRMPHIYDHKRVSLKYIK